MSDESARCPLVHANGRRCTGHVRRLRLYGRPHIGFHGVRKVRFWCSEKDDHAGIIPHPAGKERMEFYADQVPADLIPLCEEELAREMNPQRVPSTRWGQSIRS